MTIMPWVRMKLILKSPMAAPDALPSYPPGDPINLEVTVTLKPIDLDDDGSLDDTIYIKPNPYNVIIRLYDCLGGDELIAERILCGPGCSISDNSGDLVTVTAAGGHQTYSVTFPLTEWFPNLGPGCYIAEANM